MNNLFKMAISIFLAIAITSCSSDENANDPIVGNWEYVTQFENGIKTPVDDCKPSTIAFSASGNRIDLYYDENFNGECVVVDDVNSAWEKISANSYKFTQNGFEYIETVTFENLNDLLVLEHSDTNGDGNIIVYKFIYYRVN